MIPSQALSDMQVTGQRLMVGFEGQVLDETLARLITDLCVGGIALFKRNISSPGQLATLCREAQALSRERGNPPLLVAIDQEGGPVARLGPPFTVFPGNRVIGRSHSPAASAEQFGTITAQELLSVGINMNFAPVLDTTPFEDDAFVMRDRVFGNDPELVGALGGKLIDRMQSGGVAATAKHFPGIGRTTMDSHADLPFLDTEQEILQSGDLVPFRRAIEQNVSAVMLAHVVYKDIDPDWPASLSTRIGKDLLRRQMGFRGVTITDDLDMGAIARHYGVDTVIERICAAEIDVALICRNGKTVKDSQKKLMEVAYASDEARNNHRVSAERVLALKERFIGEM